MQRLLGLVRKAVTEYEMISPGDRIAVGVSGGKDSVALAVVLGRLRSFLGVEFDIVAVTLDPCFEGVECDYSPVTELFEQEGIRHIVKRTDIGSIVFDVRGETNPCSLCARMRRGALHDLAKAEGCNKIALGHHRDDAVETFLMSLLFEGRISCFQPVTYLDRTQVVQIRPMLYLPEQTVAHFAQKMDLPVVHNTCPADKQTKRQEIKELVYQLSAVYPDLKTRVFGAMQRLPLPYWAPDGTPFQPKR